MALRALGAWPLACAAACWPMRATSASPAGAPMPLESLRFVIPGAAGGVLDATGRMLAAALQHGQLVREVQFDNRAAAGGTVAMAQMALGERASAQSLLIGGLAVLAQSQAQGLGFARLTPLARLASDVLVVVAPPKAGWHDFREIADWWRQSPASVALAGAPLGSTEHLLAASLALALGIDAQRLRYVPAADADEAHEAVLRGAAVAAIAPYGQFAEQIAHGKLKALAVSAGRRVGGVVTLRELGIDVEFVNWRGVFGPPGLAPARRDQLLELLRRALDSESWRSAAAAAGWFAAPLFGDDFRRFVDAEIQRVDRLVNLLGLAQR
jgi:putative tricarboxylic transport membrane protein